MVAMPDLRVCCVYCLRVCVRTQQCSHISVSTCVYVLHVCICDSVFQALKSVGVAKPSNVTDYLLEYSFLGANY